MTSEPRTAETGSSSSPPARTRLLVTPTVSDSTGPGRTRPIGRGFNLRTQVALTLTQVGDAAAPHARKTEATPALLPTPLAGDGVKGSPRQKGSKGDLSLPSAIAALGHMNPARPKT
ncbi:hypothetical protein [Kitasatospora acidiphila]|uniref:hypothetical protein n=1 Tax=Kitasatospora acidiphila TaxID=2567942 RepID=UPI003C7550BD